MKKIFTILGIVAVATVSAQTQVVNETFTFTGALNANGWTRHSGTAGETMSNGTEAVLLETGTEDLNKAFSTPYAITANATNKVQYSASINVQNSNDLLANTSAGDYFLSLGATEGASVTVLPARLYVKQGSSATTYVLGVLNTSGGTATPTYSTTEITYGTAANVVVTFEVVTGSTTTQTASLSVNGGTAVSNSTGTGTASANLASVALRQGGNTGNVLVDNLVVTTYPASVLGVSDVSSVKSNFVRNTMVNNEINFGTKAEVKVYNMNGQVVRSASVSENNNLEVSDLAPGMYIVTGTVNGEAVSQKILKK